MSLLEQFTCPSCGHFVDLDFWSLLDHFLVDFWFILESVVPLFSSVSRGRGGKNWNLGWFKLWMHFSTPKIFNFSLGTHCTLFKTKDTNRKIRKCSVHRLYIKLFSSIDVYISQFNKEPPGNQTTIHRYLLLCKTFDFKPALLVSQQKSSVK